jgi:hypothetical protein
MVPRHAGEPATTDPAPDDKTPGTEGAGGFPGSADQSDPPVSFSRSACSASSEASEPEPEPGPESVSVAVSLSEE